MKGNQHMKLPKGVDKLLTIFGYTLALVPYAILGAYSAHVATNLLPTEDIPKELLIMSAMVLSGAVFLYIHIILHEGGHLLFGLLTGWKFVSFRIGNQTLVKQNGKLKCKKTTVAGTGGQCLMSPPDCPPENCPFFLYLLGGGLANILSGILALLIALPVNGLWEAILHVFAITAIGLGLMNLFPAKLSGSANDGYQIFIELPHNPKAKAEQAILLNAHAYLTDHESSKDMPSKLRQSILDTDSIGPMYTATTNLLCYKAVLLQEENRYEEANAIYQQIADDEDTLPIFKYEATCELIYYEIMGECNGEKIDTLMDKKQESYIKATLLYPSRRRLMYAYYLIYKKDEAAAQKEYEALQKTVLTHPSKAEGAIELKEAERVKQYALTLS